jgi:hypothetical protein
MYAGEISGSHGYDMKKTVSWVAAPCRLVKVCGRFGKQSGA